MNRPLTDVETLMWKTSHTSFLATTMGAIALLDGVPEPNRLRDTVAGAVTEVEALRTRIHASTLPFGRAEWVDDHEFELGHHLRFLRLPPRATLSDFHRTATQLINDPFDLERPLWQVFAVSGLPRRRSGLVLKFHHSVSDGQGLLQIAKHLLEWTATTEPPGPVDLSVCFPARVATDPTQALAESIQNEAEHIVGRLQQVGQKLGQPQPDGSVANDAPKMTDHLGALRKLLDPSESPPSGIWPNRSSKRTLRLISIDQSLLRHQSEKSQATINDLFVAAATTATISYQLGGHANGDDERTDDRDPTFLPGSITLAVPISTRKPGDLSNQNAVVPTTITLRTESMSLAERLEEIQAAISAQRATLATLSDPAQFLGGLASLVPDWLSAAVGRAQTARIDLVTSNLVGPPVPVWMGGCPVRSLHPVGPVAGTAGNLTLLSYNGSANFGLNLDPSAITDPDRFTRRFREALREFDVGQTGPR